MFFLLTTHHIKKHKIRQNKGKISIKESKIVVKFLVISWIILILFFIISLTNPKWLSELSDVGKEVGAAEYLDFANYSRQNRQFNRAINEYKEALKLNPDMIEAISNLAITYAQIGQNDKAIATLQKALKQGHKEPYIIYHNLAVIYKNMGNLDESLKYYKKTLETDPFPLYTYIDIGNFHFRNKKWYNAINNFRNAINYRLNMKAFYEGRLKKDFVLYSSEPEIQEAIQDILQKGITEKDMEPYDNTIFQNILKKDKNLAQLYDQIGYSFYNKGELENAIPYYHKSLDIWSGVKNRANKNLKNALELLKRKDE